jgi:hypothetical protein
MKNSMAILLRSTSMLAGHSVTPRHSNAQNAVHTNKHIVDELSDEEWVD